MVRSSTPDKVAEAVKQYYPRVLHASLSKEGKDLVKALQT
jgi:hypothetical protein